VSHPFRRTAVAAVAALALGGSLAACGSDKDTKDAATGVSPTSSTTADATGSASSSPSAAASESSTGDGSTSGALTKANFADAMSAAIKAKGSAHMTMSMANSLRASGDVSYAGKSPAMQMTMTMSGAKIEMRFVDDTMYMSIPGMTPKGKFVAITGDDATFGPMLKQFRELGPDGSVAMMRKGVKEFKHVGRAKIDGKSFEHYRVTIDPSVGLAALGMDNVPGDSAKIVTQDLYVDKDNLMRRTVMTVSGQTITVDVTDWGKPVRISAPPASQVTKAPAGLAG
jgi:hypothetical protein